MRTKYRQWAVDYIDNEKSNQFDVDDFDVEKFDKFNNGKPLFIEIGPGKGQFILSLAKKFPQNNYLIFEYNKTIAGMCLKSIDDAQVDNIKMVAQDFFKFADLLINHHVKIDGIFLNFSDPWPKKRHEKRRLTSDIFLNKYLEILKDDHFIYYKSDNDDFFKFSLEQFKKFNFDVIGLNFDYNNLDDFDACTEFETKFHNNGIKIKRIIARKTAKTIKRSEDLI